MENKKNINNSYKRGVGPTDSGSLFKMIKNFTVEVGKYIVGGIQNVTPEDYADRLDACLKCPHIQKENMKCGICGCFLGQKAKWKTTTCPDNPERWKKQIVNDQRRISDILERIDKKLESE